MENIIVKTVLGVLSEVLDKFCRDKGLEPAYMPQTCFKKDGTFDFYKNCICQDKDGFCEICYPHSEKLAEEELRRGFNKYYPC